MIPSLSFSQISKKIASKLTEEIVKVLLRNQQPDLYYSLERSITNSLLDAYENGLIEGRRQVTEAVMRFDLEEDKLES